MGSRELGFDRPEYLLVLLLVPALWLVSYRTLAALGPVRRAVALGLRTTVLLLLVLALAELQVRQVSDKVTVLYLLDQSESIPRAKRELMREFVVEHVRRHRDAERNDRAGVIVFAREAAIEVPPYDDDIPNLGAFEAFLERRDATNLEGALKLAAAAFPEDSAKRVVIVTDGNENLGNARGVAAALAASGIAIDVIPVQSATRGEIAVEKVTLPADIRRGTPFEVRTVLQNFAAPRDEDPRRVVRGKLRVTRKLGRREDLVGETAVELPPGKTVIGLRHVLDEPALHTYQATFLPDDPADDLLPQNNAASAYTQVRGRGRVLLIEDVDHAGEFDFLVARLRAMNLELDVQPSNQLFTGLDELQGYDCVILANVPRASGSGTADISGFRDEQIEMLVRNTQQLGAGLVLLGGPQSFGAGGWANTPLEDAMPVDFQIKNAKIEAVGALALLMHASELPEGNHWQKVVAREAIKALGPLDYCGLLYWDDLARDTWLWGDGAGLMRLEGQREMMLARINRLTPGDMPEFDPSMRKALDAFQNVTAAVKHMIVVSDGDPIPPRPATLSLCQQAGIQITTVAVGTHGPPGSTPLRDIAAVTGGQYYVVDDPQLLPKIYQREARRVSRPVVKDLPNVAPEIVYPHEIMQGIAAPLPPLTGMVLTTVKDNPLVEVVLRSPEPSDTRNATVLATWTYGLGRAAVVTTDAGHRWAAAWTAWPGYDKFFGQLVRWAMRPASDPGKYTVTTDVRDDKVRVVITALDANDDFRNALRMTASAVGPDLDASELPIRQVAPGRYIGEFDASKAGSYHVSIVPAAGEPPLITGVNVPYAAEFRERDTNRRLLQDLASLRPPGGQPGLLADLDLNASNRDQLLEVNTFRPGLPKASRIEDIWPLLLFFSAWVFLADVFVRRVAVSLAWLEPVAARVWRLVRPPASAAQVSQRLEQLRTRKDAIAQTLEQRRAAAYVASPDGRVLEEGPGVAAPPSAPLPAPTAVDAAPPSDAVSSPAPSAEDAAYTARLLEAKRKARADHERQRKKEP